MDPDPANGDHWRSEPGRLGPPPSPGDRDWSLEAASRESSSAPARAPSRLWAGPNSKATDTAGEEIDQAAGVVADDAQAARGAEGHASGPSSAHGTRQLKIGVGVPLAIIVLVACVATALVVAVPSSSSRQSQHLRQVASPPTSAAPPPATTAPPPANPTTISPRSSNRRGAVYTTGSSHQVVSTLASGSVWLEFVAGTQPSGSVLWQGFLSNGQSHTVTSNGPIWLRIGDVPNVTISVNGARVSIPPDTGVYNLTFSAS